MRRGLIATIASAALVLSVGGIAVADDCDHNSSHELASRVHLDLLSRLLGDNDKPDDDGLIDLASILRFKHESDQTCK